MRTLKWLGNSRKDVLTFPEEIRLQIGFALYTAQLGETHMHAKLFKGFGPGVYEIISDYDKNTYRTLYTVNIEDAIYVLHVFQKKIQAWNSYTKTRTQGS